VNPDTIQENRTMTRTMFLCLAAVTLLTACATEDNGRDSLDNHVEAASTFSMDSTAIATTPAATLPASRLAASAFAESSLTSRLVRTDETFTTLNTVGSRVMRQSTGWHLEHDAAKGSVLFVRRTTPGAPINLTDAQLQQSAVQRLAAWGLPASETLRVLQRRTMQQPEEGGVRGVARLHRHKTLVLRGFNGVPVEGHRVVVTHSPDGVVHRGLVRWPALAASGHRLRTTLTRATIVSRAIAALQAAGETGGQATLRWKYVATLNAAGEAVLTLTVGARMGAVDSAEHTEEPREIDVDISAIQ
jgi:hypothetical protein